MGTGTAVLCHQACFMGNTRCILCSWQPSLLCIRELGGLPACVLVLDAYYDCCSLACWSSRAFDVCTCLEKAARCFLPAFWLPALTLLASTGSFFTLRRFSFSIILKFHIEQFTMVHFHFHTPCWLAAVLSRGMGTPLFIHEQTHTHHILDTTAIIGTK